MFHCFRCLSHQKKKKMKATAVQREQNEANKESGTEWSLKTLLPYQLKRPLSGLAEINRAKVNKQKKKKTQGIGIMPWTFYLRLLHGGPAHKALVIYRCMAGTPQKPNLLSRDKANSAEKSAMCTAVSKAITREQEHSLPTSSSCFPSPIDVTFQQLEQDVLIKVTVAVKRREREWKVITETETRQMFFLITKESKCKTDALLLIITIFLCSMTGFTNLELSHI